MCKQNSLRFQLGTFQIVKFKMHLSWKINQSFWNIVEKFCKTKLRFVANQREIWTFVTVTQLPTHICLMPKLTMYSFWINNNFQRKPARECCQCSKNHDHLIISCFKHVTLYYFIIIYVKLCMIDLCFDSNADKKEQKGELVIFH